jgi:hypothetical protein
VWSTLHTACTEDHETALAIVQAAELQLPQESLTTAIDSQGIYYRVPIACINDPKAYSVNKLLE